MIIEPCSFINLFYEKDDYNAFYLEGNNLINYFDPSGSYSKNVCTKSPSSFLRAFFTYFKCNQGLTQEPTVNVPIFRMTGLPPHYQRDAKIESMYLTDDEVTVVWKLDNSQFDVKYGTVNTRLQFDCSANDDDVDHYFLINKTYDTTGITKNTECTLRAQESCDSKSDLSIGQIQLNLNLCHPSCLECTGPDENQCKTCHTCATLTADKKCQKANTYFQFGQCVSSCDNAASFFLYQNFCFKIPFCQLATNGICQKCLTGKFLIPNYQDRMSQCVDDCPVGFTADNVSKICQDNTIYVQKLAGAYIKRGLFSNTFSGIEVKQLGLTMTKNQATTMVNSSLLSRCSKYQLFGGFFVNFKDTSINLAELTTSNQKYVKIRFKYFFVDYPTESTATDTAVSVNIGTEESYNINISSTISKSNLCGFDLNASSKSTTDIIGEFVKDFTIPTTNKIKLTILNANTLSKVGSGTTANLHAYFGIRELSLYTFNCKQSNCLACSSDTVCTQCDTGYLVIANNCQQCNSMCETCQNTINECILCKGNKIWNSTTKTCDCPSGTYWNSTSCVTCPTTNCSSCSQTSPYPCLACTNPNYLLGNTCVSSCGNNYYQNSSNYKCEACVSNCKVCSNTTTCTECISGYLSPAGQCVTSCSTGQFTDTQNNKCIPCTDTNCNTCSPQNICTTCKSAFYQQGQICQANCDPGYYADTATQKCLTCSSKISNCQECTSSTCTKCSTNFYLLNGKCESTCPYGYYSSQVNGINVCVACMNPKCGTCNASSNLCLTCNLAQYPYKQGDLCVDQCSSGYYLESNTCKLCSTKFTGCQTCNLTKCLTCSTSTHFLDQVNNSCGTTCPSDTYKQIVSGGQNLCTLCDSQCLTCGTSPANCLTCPTNNPLYLYQQGDKCKSQCDPKYYPDLSNICKTCSSKFTQCGICTINDCIDCNDPNFYLIVAENKCVSSCPEGYVVDTNSAKLACVKCINNCKTCDSVNTGQCLSCYTTSTSQYPYKKGTDCVSNCGTDYFADLQKLCHSCKSTYNGSCEECNASNCIKCESPLLLNSVGWGCVNVCPPEAPQIYSGMCVEQCADNNCVLCDQSNTSICNQCVSTSNLQGTVCQSNCNPGYFTLPNQNVCTLCSSKYADCLECNSDICTICSDNSKIFNPPTNQCELTCSDGYYKDAGNTQLGCQLCHNSKCLQCDPLNPAKCITCKPSPDPYYLMENNDCVNTCSPQYYQSGTSCLQCPIGCQTCNASGCQSCLGNYYLDTSNATCVTDCPPNFYKGELGGNNVCISCGLLECKTCELFDKQLCTSCFSNTGGNEYLEENKCVTTCSSGFYLNTANKTCDKCSDKYPSCATCNSTICLTCQPTTYYNNSTKSCDSTCPQKFYGSLTWECVACPQHCLTCDSAKCFICDDQSFLQANLCQTTCNIDYYGDNSDKICKLCSTKFSNCKECTETQCTVCNNSSLYLNIATNECIASCNFDNHYIGNELNGQFACYRCINPDCKTCNSTGDCLSCFDPSQKPYWDQDKYCVAQCPNVYDLQLGKCTNSCQYPQVPDDITKHCVNCPDYIYNSKCHLNCPISTVNNPDGTKTCLDCSSQISDCAECSLQITNPTQIICTKCLSSYLQNDGTCSNICPPNQFKDDLLMKCVTNCDVSNGYYADGSTLKCEQCNLSLCQECQNKNDECTLCKADEFLNLADKTCYKICPSSKYGETTTHTCENCSADCLQCTSITECTKCNTPILYLGICYSSCPSGTLLLHGQCVLTCPQRYFADSVKNECIFCQDNCSQCSELSKCGQCDQGYVIQTQFASNIPCLDCSTGFYENVCTKCPTYCIKCQENIAQKSIQCIQCSESDGYYLVKDKCLYCYGNTDEIYDSSLNKCVKKFIAIGPTPKLSVIDEANQVEDKIFISAKISFDKKVKIISTSQWKLKIDLEEEDSYEIRLLTTQSSTLSSGQTHLFEDKQIPINIIINKQFSNEYSTLFIDFVDASSVIEENGKGLILTELESPLPKISVQDQTKQSSAQQAVKSLLTISQVLFMATSPFYMVVSFFDLIQMMNYLLYLNVSYPSFLHSVIQIFDFANFEIIPNIKNDHSKSPYKFQLENVDTFVYSNLIQSVVVWSTSFIIYMICKIIANSQRFVASKNIFINFTRVYHQNYLYKIIIGLGFLTYCDLLLAVFLQFYDSSNISALEAIGTLSAVVLLSLIIGLNYLSFSATQIHISDLQINQKIKKIYGFLYNGYLLNNSKPMMNFIFLIRKSVVLYQLVFNQENPVSQVFICCLIFGFETTFMSIAKPYRNRRELIINIVCRYLLIIGLVFIIILSMDDNLQKLSSGSRDFLGIITSLLLITIYFAYFSYIIKQIYINYKKSKFSPNASSIKLVN